MAHDSGDSTWRKQFLFRGNQVEAIRAAADYLEDAQTTILQEMEVLRMCWEMKFAGMGPTAIERTLRGGPSWQWRSRRQIEDLCRPGDWRFYPLESDAPDKAGQ